MQNFMTIDDITLICNKLTYEYTVSGDWEKYFINPFWLEYSEELSNSIPKGILAIPLISAVLPLAMIVNATIVVPELDKNFYNSIPNLKAGYQKKYPSINFAGSIEPQNIIKYDYEPQEKSLTLFSGGVDSLNTLISNINENLTLVTIRGGDPPLDYPDDIWQFIKENVSNVGKQFNAENIFIQSMYRLFTDEKVLSKLIRTLDNNIPGWYPFQLGVSMVSTMVPYAYLHKIKRIYMASCYTYKYKFIGPEATGPEIENNFKFSSCEVVHDAYDCTRQEKVQNICNYYAENNKSIIIHACGSMRPGICCSCEKCIRTIAGILAEKQLPENYGFIKNNTITDVCNYLKKRDDFLEQYIMFWLDIQNRFKENYTKPYENADVDWFCNVNFYKMGNIQTRTKKQIIKTLKRLKKSFKKTALIFCL